MVGTKKLSRILDQFRNILCLLAEMSPHFKIDNLLLLDPQGRADIEGGNHKVLLDSPTVEKSIDALFHGKSGLA